MKILVTYKTRTGFTRKYAEMIAEEITCSLMEFKDVTIESMSDFDVVIFGGGLHAGRVDGLRKAKDMFAKSSAKKFVVYVTGATPNEAKEIVDGVWTDNFSEEEINRIPHFYMQSGLCYEKMSIPDAAMSKKQNKTEHEEGFEQAIKSSYDISSKEYVKPLVEYIKEFEK